MIALNHQGTFGVAIEMHGSCAGDVISLLQMPLSRYCRWGARLFPCLFLCTWRPTQNKEGYEGGYHHHEGERENGEDGQCKSEIPPPPPRG